MPERVTLEAMDAIRPLAVAAVTEYARRLRSLRYCDLRLELSEGKGSASENGHPKGSNEDYGFSLGVRVLAGRDIVAAGYVGRMLGSADLGRLEQVMREAIQSSHCRALASAQRKAAGRSRFGSLGESLSSTELAPIPVHHETIAARYRTDPRSVPLKEVEALAVEVSRQVASGSQQVCTTWCRRPPC